MSPSDQLPIPQCRIKEMETRAKTHRDGRASRHPDPAVHEHLPTLLARLVDPLADGLQLRLERVDAVVAHTLDVEHLDPALALLDPERARLRRHEPRLERALPVFGRD